MIKENNPDNDNYYLICPDCQIRSPHIEKLYYNEDLKDIMVKYTCICFQNPRKSKEIQLINIFGKNEPKNMCIIHPEFKLKNFCSTCRRAICQICEKELHNMHYIENAKSSISKEDADKMLKIIEEGLELVKEVNGFLWMKIKHGRIILNILEGKSEKNRRLLMLKTDNKH